MYLNKVVTVVAGCTKSRDFNYACYITDNLSELLPNFSVHKIGILLTDWETWLADKCQNHKWSHTSSPLIWREIGVCGGSCTYIGGLEEYKNFIQHYYGINPVLSTLDEKVLDLNPSLVIYKLLFIFGIKYELNESKNNILRITIYGAGRSVCPDLVAQLATIKEINEDGVSIQLHDKAGHYFKINDIIEDAVAIGGELRSIRNIENLSDGLKNCNVLIVLDLTLREDQDSINDWLKENYKCTKNVAEQINVHAPADMKVIFCSTGPACFCANVMMKEATKLNKNNIVVVSAHWGLEMIYEFTKSINVSIKEFGCPPIWGFLGVNYYVDMSHTLQRCSVYVPNKRALNSYNSSSLSLGIKYEENRWFSYLTFDKKPHEILSNRKAVCLYQVGRTEDFQKCKAICDLLKLWYQKDVSLIGDEIITLGVASNGTFHFPENLFFSQPVYLKVQADNSRVWVPYSEFPLPADMKAILQNFIDTAINILQTMNLFDGKFSVDLKFPRKASVINKVK
ncbi:putative malate dehydrogenase 1B [Phymastichus coffea]|uniref:putative malate dehydrogenase 1B n=1 Tax=Phymastichus coffea TaxID=108790 RepID=UPI00273C3ECA|nr:putative malate dehydrogenase 1B [Phymastichus coffea]